MTLAAIKSAALAACAFNYSHTGGDWASDGHSDADIREMAMDCAITALEAFRDDSGESLSARDVFLANYSGAAEECMRADRAADVAVNAHVDRSHADHEGSECDGLCPIHSGGR